MLSTTESQHALDSGGQVIDSDGGKIGKVGQIFLDDATDQPAWVTVRTGLFGGAESFVPLDRATLDGDDVVVPFDKAKVKDAPRVQDADGRLSPEEEDELYRFYEMDGHPSRTGDPVPDGHATDTGPDLGAPVATGEHRGAGHDTSGPDTDSAMTRSEEQLRVGTTAERTGKARLRKYVVTEDVTRTVPVSHEEVRVEREPITDANRGDATAGGDITEEEHEVELSAERVVVEKEAVPVERVRMDTETVTEQQTVDEQVRKEQIETDQVSTTRNDQEDRRG